MARDDGEAEFVRRAHPGSRLLRADRSDLPRSWAYRSLRIYGCALGPIHPQDSPELGADAERAARDLDLVERLVDASRGVPVHVLFVSSVLALAPRKQRRYYAGWKSVVESEMIRILALHPRATLSVVYPGRLIDGEGAGLPAKLLHTTYGTLAELLANLHPGNRNRLLVGTDARAWIVRHRRFVISDGPRPSTVDLPTQELAAELHARRRAG